MTPAPLATGRRDSAGRVRVLQVVLNLHQGGLERVLGDLVRGLDHRVFDVHVLALQFLGELSAGLEEFATLHVAPPQPRWSILRPSLLRDEIARIAPNVVHSHSGVWYKASRAARMARVPFVVHTDHGRQSPDPWAHRFTDGLASRRTDVVVAVSEVLGQQLARTIVRDPARIVVIRNGVDTDRFQPRTTIGRVRAELGIPDEVPIIGSIGRLDPIKRFDIMIESLAILRAEWTGRHAPVLVIAGGGPERERLESLVAARGLEGRVHLLGWRQDVHDLHKAFTIFTMSSRSEGTSIGLLEAMSAGLCPVVTAVGGNPDVLGEALRHRLCAAEDARSLATAWADALASETRRHSDALLARQRVVTAFSLRAMVAAHEAIYTAGVSLR